MQAFEGLMNFLDGILGSAFYFPFVLLGVGVFFTLYLGFPQIRFFKHAWSVLRGKHSHADDPGDTTHFQALSTALSGTVGTGNIGGVAFAIFLGGPAALFWMWATAFVGMTTKFVEVVAVPPGVVTEMGPVVAPVGTCVRTLSPLAATPEITPGMPLNATAEALSRFTFRAGRSPDQNR